MCFMLMGKQRLLLVRKISCQKLTTNKTSECFNYEVGQRLPRIPRSILDPKTFVDNPKILNTSLNVCRPSFSIKKNNEKINITWGNIDDNIYSGHMDRLTLFFSPMPSRSLFTPICIFLEHKVAMAFVNRIPWPASASPFPLLRKLRPLHCFL